MKRTLTILTMVCGVIAAQAGTIRLMDGSTIHGEIKSIRKGTAEIKTSIGKLKVPIKEVESMVSEKRLWVALDRTGVLRRHSIVHYENGNYLINGDPVDPVLKTRNIEVAWDESTKDPFKRIWKHEISAYYTGRSGNYDQEYAGGGCESRLSGPTDRLKLYAKSLYARRNSVETDNELTTGADYERDFTKNNSFYFLNEFNHDEIDGIKIRQIYGTGYGHYFVNQSHHKLRTRLGIQYRNELYEDDTRWEGPAFDLGFLHTYQKGLLGKLETEVTYSPKINSTGDDYLLHHNTSWDVPLNVHNWRLRLGLKNDYNEEPVGDRDHLDTQYYVRVIFSW